MEPENAGAGPMPPDPFAPDHQGFVTLLHLFRGFRAAGASVTEAAVMIGGILRAGRDEGPAQPGA